MRSLSTMTRRLIVVVGLVAVFASLLLGCGGSASPGAPPDLIFVSSRGGDYAVFGMTAEGGDQHQLTESEGDASSPESLFFQIEPSWSPDGRSIAFASKREGSFDIFVMRSDGEDTRRLTTSREDETHPTWSPDGKRIAFERGDHGDLEVMNADGTGQRRLTRDDAAETDPAWSPDGRWIAYSRRIPGTPTRDVWVVRPDGSRAHGLTSLAGASYSPAWTPDSRQVTFSSNAGTPTFSIYTIGVDAKGLRRLARGTDDEFEPAWSPDGKTLAFSRNGSIVTIDAQGVEKALTEGENNDSSPAWNPRPARQE